MTRVDFYVIPEGEDDPLPTACRLCDKAVANGLKVHVHVPDPEQAKALDRMLWTFRQGAFLAHERLDDTAEQPSLAAILLGDGEPPASHQGVMVNLGGDVPAFFSRFERVLEIVYGSEAERARSRERFKYYRDRGYPLETHTLTAA